MQSSSRRTANFWLKVPRTRKRVLSAHGFLSIGIAGTGQGIDFSTVRIIGQFAEKKLPTVVCCLGQTIEEAGSFALSKMLEMTVLAPLQARFALMLRTEPPPRKEVGIFGRASWWGID